VLGDGESIDSESIDGESIDGESIDGESIDGESIDGETCEHQMSGFTAFVTKKLMESIRRRRASSCVCVFGEASAQGMRPAKINWTAVGRRRLVLYGYTKSPARAESFITINCPVTGISALMTTFFSRN